MFISCAFISFFFAQVEIMCNYKIVFLPTFIYFYLSLGFFQIAFVYQNVYKQMYPISDYLKLNSLFSSLGKTG